MKKDPALTISNPHMLGAVYFGLLSVVGTILINGLLSSLGVEEMVPVFASVLWGMVVASSMGWLFGESIVHCKKPYLWKTFWMGFGMVILSLPVFDLGLFLMMKEGYTQQWAPATIQNPVLIYCLMLLYSYALFGILLAIASGAAAMYLRAYLVYDILHNYDDFGQYRRKFRSTPLKHAHATSHKVRVHHHHK